MKRCHPAVELLQALRVDRNALYAMLNCNEATFRAWEQGNASPSRYQAQMAVFCAKYPEVIERFVYVSRWAKQQGLLPDSPAPSIPENNAPPFLPMGPPVLPLPDWMRPAPYRQLGREEKRQRIVLLCQQHPDWSSREIARIIGGVSNGTVSRLRKTLERSAESR